MGGGNGKENGFIQPSLSGMEAVQPEETELDNCLVLSRPVYKDTGKNQKWTCTLHVQPTIFQPDTDMVFLAFASKQQAIDARKVSLKPGDRVRLTGTISTETLTLSSGETQIIGRIVLTRPPQVSAREKRVSTTVYEQRKPR